MFEPTASGIEPTPFTTRDPNNCQTRLSLNHDLWNATLCGTLFQFLTARRPPRLGAQTKWSEGTERLGPCVGREALCTPCDAVDCRRCSTAGCGQAGGSSLDVWPRQSQGTPSKGPPRSGAPRLAYLGTHVPRTRIPPPWSRWFVVCSWHEAAPLLGRVVRGDTVLRLAQGRNSPHTTHSSVW